MFFCAQSELYVRKKKKARADVEVTAGVCLPFRATMKHCQEHFLTKLHIIAQ